MGKSGDGRAPARLVYDPNIRTMGSLRELDAYVSSTPFASESVSGRKGEIAAQGGGQDVAEDGRDLALHHGVHDGGPPRACDGGEGAKDDA